MSKPVLPGQTLRTDMWQEADKVEAGSREQGAESREQGAGSGGREQGAGSREQGAGSRELPPN